jgi:CubicO group peptidase (beta-lactamase class C family)
MKFHEDGNRTFIEQSDGTLMFTTTLVPAEDYKRKYPHMGPPEAPNYEYGGKPQDLFGDIIFRSTDGGQTWGDPSHVYTDLNPHESALAIDPKNPNRILEFARIQRLVRPDEDAKEMMRMTGNPRPYYKQAALFESTDGGRKFRLVPSGMTDWYGHRGSILWTKRNVVVLTHNAGQNDSRVLARISLDGGRTWVDGNEQATALMTKSTKFVLAPSHSFTTPTVELAENHFLTVYCIGNFAVRGVFWHLAAENQ